MQRNITPLLDELRTLHSDITQTLLESFEGLKTIRSYRTQADEKHRFDEKLKLVESKGLRVAKVFGGLLGSNDIVIQMLTAISLTFVMYSLKGSQLTLEAAFIYPFYLGMFYRAAEALSAATIDWSSFFVEGGRLAKLLKKNENDHSENLPESSHYQNELGNQSISKLEISGLSYGYNKEEPLAKDISMSIQKGKTIALVGPSGCGKSTALEVLAGLRSAFSGSWQIEGQGNSSNDFALKNIPIDLSVYVEQRPYIFEGTIRANLLLGRTGITDSEIWDALKASNCTNFVKNSGGLDVVLRDAGRNISEGQRYRLALARALLVKRPMLLLDEPFAALDQFSTDLICRTINKNKKERMTLIVTHYLPERLEVDHVWNWQDLSQKSLSSPEAVVVSVDNI